MSTTWNGNCHGWSQTSSIIALLPPTTLATQTIAAISQLDAPNYFLGASLVLGAAHDIHLYSCCYNRIWPSTVRWWSSTQWASTPLGQRLRTAVVNIQKLKEESEERGQDMGD